MFRYYSYLINYVYLAFDFVGDTINYFDVYTPCVIAAVKEVVIENKIIQFPEVVSKSGVISSRILIARPLVSTGVITSVLIISIFLSYGVKPP